MIKYLVTLFITTAVFSTSTADLKEDFSNAKLALWVFHEDGKVGMSSSIVKGDDGNALRIEVKKFVPGRDPIWSTLTSPMYENIIDYEFISFDMMAENDTPNIAFGQGPQAGIPPSVTNFDRMKADERRKITLPMTRVIRKEYPGAYLAFYIPRSAEKDYAFRIENIRFYGSRIKTKLKELEKNIRKHSSDFKSEEETKELLAKIELCLEFYLPLRRITTH